MSRLAIKLIFLIAKIIFPNCKTGEHESVILLYFNRTVLKHDSTHFIIDETSFVALYNCYWFEALTFARQLVQDEYVAEDLVQNIFISLWHRKDTLNIQQPVGHYLKRSVKFAVAAYVRDKARKETIELTPLHEPAHANTDDTLLHRELINKLTDIVDGLPEQNQKVYNLRFQHAMDNPQIADMLCISEKTVRNQLSLALKKIRILLVKEGYSI